ncbi:MAG: LamG-like jellyroll fold domain-containing protein, partial [Planctomycetota bacterium]
AWVRADTSGVTQSVIDKANGSELGYRLRLDGGGGGYAFCNVWNGVGVNGGGRTNSQLVQGAWTYLACVYNGTQVKTYFDGNNELNYGYSSGIGDSPIDFQLGARGNGQQLHGLMDEARVATTDRSDDWIFAQFKSMSGTLISAFGGEEAAGLIGHWNFNEGSGQTAADASASNNNGTLGPTAAVESGDPTWACSGSALDFDGSDDEVKLSSVAIGDRAAWSITAWIKMGADAADKRTIYGEGNTAQTEYLYLQVLQGGSTVEFYSQNFGASNWARLDGTTDVEDDAWHLVTVVQRSKTDRELYVGTNSEDTNAQDAGTLSFNTASIGYLRTDWVADPFLGTIDDVRVYDYALSPAEIAALAGSPPAACGAGGSVTLSGTVTDDAETDIRTGGSSIILTLAGDTWVAAGAAFDAERQNIIDGLTSAGAEANGWNNVVQVGLNVTDVVRTSNTVVTVTLPAFAAYDITATETITATVPASALVTSSSPYVASPTFDVTAVTPTAALSGTVTDDSEADIVAGGSTVILTLTNDTWVAAGAAFDAERQNIIDGLVSAQSEASGWNNVVQAGLNVTDIVRTSNTVVTVTLPAFPTYNITATETITATVPASALVTSGSPLVASPTFDVTVVTGGLGSWSGLGCSAIIDTTSTSFGAVGSVSVSHTTSGTDRLMLVGVSTNNDNFEIVDSVLYNGVHLSLVDSIASVDDARVEIWQLANPPTGTHNVEVWFSAILLRGGTVGVMTLSGVDQGTPLGAPAGAFAQNDAGPATVDVPSALNELVFGATAVESGGPLTTDPAQDEWWNLDNASRDYGAGSTKDGAAGTVTLAWALNSSDHWAALGVSINPATCAAASAALSGTVTDDSETDIRAGSSTIVLTLSGDTWVAAGAAFDAERQNIIDGLVSAQSEANGWNNGVQAGLNVTDVVRTSNTVVTITLPAFAGYDVTATETITATIPASALVTSGSPLVASPTFDVTVAAGTVALSGTVTDDSEPDIRAGGSTIVVTLTDDSWVAAGAAFDAERQNIIDGLTSAGAEANGWNNVVQAGLNVTDVVRTSNTVVTVTLPAFAAYDITANETITATVPATALVQSAGAIVAAPTFSITAATFDVTGNVFEDTNGDANVAAEPAVVGATVSLYLDGGDGIANGIDDIFIDSVATGAAGDYSFASLADGSTYWVLVDTKTVPASAGLNGGSVQGDIWAEQTYGVTGAQCDDGLGSIAELGAAGPCYGGQSSVTSDGAPTLANAEHVTRVVLAGADATGVHFGFSFNVVVNTLAGDAQDDDGAANRSVQGSLRQFIQNANAIAGANTMRFVPAGTTNATDGGGNDWWRTDVTQALPTIGDANTT